MTPGSLHQPASALGPSETWIVDLEQIEPPQRHLAGGKAVSLAALLRKGIRVPPGLTVLTSAYDRFVEGAGLRQAVALELGRKRFEDMRFEELWDASLRIRNLFMRTAVDPLLGDVLKEALSRRFGSAPCVVRSSAPGEDTAATSFAGLHESFVNVSGADGLVDAIRRVWASLWTDRALLYKQELGLDVFSSTMAVVVQELITGEASGVAFSRSPLERSQAVIEAVWGLNEGLVDGTIEPDRWTLDRETGALLEHHSPLRAEQVVSADTGTHAVPLPPERRTSPPLDAAEVAAVFTAALTAEDLFGAPQDMEWTKTEGPLFVLQSRPVSTIQGDRDSQGGPGASSRPMAAANADAIAHAHAVGEPVIDERPWYLSLHRSFANLRLLRRRVEDEAIPAMQRDAGAMAQIDLASMSDEDLAAETARREALWAHWQHVYYSDFIPLAHGMRLFGQAYNDAVAPKDPFEFMDLLTGTSLISTERNRELSTLATLVAQGETERAADLLEDYLDRFGSGPGTPETVRAREKAGALRLLTELAAAKPAIGDSSRQSPMQDRTQAYLARFSDDERGFQEDLLDLARASYRLRDDDNIHLARIESHLEAARAVEDLRRQARQPGERRTEVNGETNGAATDSVGGAEWAQSPYLKARQLVGQPAGPGIAIGTARVITDNDDLFTFVRGEILVCDALDPTMTFVAPLAAAIVERRGGMLIHGAIIAREYGLPCVTGIPEATDAIHTGDLLTVDGYLGIVVVGGAPPA